MGPLTKELFSRKTTSTLITAGGPGSGRHSEGGVTPGEKAANYHEKAAQYQSF